MYLAQFEGKNLVLEYVSGRLITSNAPINVPKKINNMTFSVEGIRTENDYFFARYSPEYPLIKGKNYISKEYGDFLISLGFLTLPRTDNPGILPDKALMQKFSLIGWTNGEDFVCYSAYTKSLVCKSVIFQITEDGKLQASILTEETEFTTNKYSVYSRAAIGSGIMFTPGGDFIVSSHSLPIVEVPVYCPVCRCRLEVADDHRICTNTECGVVRNRFIAKLIRDKLYSPNPVIPVESLKKLETRLEILTAVFKNNPNQKILNNESILDLLEVPGVSLIDLPLEYPLMALLTNQNRLPEITKTWLQNNHELFLAALDFFETIKQKKVFYTNPSLHIERWYQKVDPSEANSFFINGKFFMEV